MSTKRNKFERLFLLGQVKSFSIFWQCEVQFSSSEYFCWGCKDCELPEEKKQKQNKTKKQKKICKEIIMADISTLMGKNIFTWKWLRLLKVVGWLVGWCFMAYQLLWVILYQILLYIYIYIKQDLAFNNPHYDMP